MKILIVDDEPLARQALQRALQTRDDVDSVAVAEDAILAFEAIKRDLPDVLFLDINMPEMNGLQLLQRLNESQIAPPAIVFVTAHSDHAVSAFEHQAVDFVLKPFATERIAKALETAIRRTQSEKAVALVESLKLMNGLSKPKRKIAIKTDGRILFVNISEISSVQAEGNYVLLQGEDTTHLLREPLNQVEEKLRPYDFVRIHRSVIVNSAYIKEIQHAADGDWILRLRNGQEFPVSRKYRDNLSFVAGVGIGTNNFGGSK
jgi:two-component system LytT family response regulator